MAPYVMNGLTGRTGRHSKPQVVNRAASCLVVLLLAQSARPQAADLHGQASAWLTTNPESPPLVQTGLRYLPNLLVKEPLGGGIDADMEVSLNAYAIVRTAGDKHPSSEWHARPYRLWLRLSTDRLEVWIGLQKINFGSAMLLRPLMWFDWLDPRDPLQLTDGVYAGLARYYFTNNVNIWLWGLYGNNNTKGLEAVPTEARTFEFGGRVQSPLWIGEIGVTYHNRRADLSPLVFAHDDGSSLIAPEDRLGLDGKWDIGIGVWFEGVLVRQESGLLGAQYQRQWDGRGGLYHSCRERHVCSDRVFPV